MSLTDTTLRTLLQRIANRKGDPSDLVAAAQWLVGLPYEWNEFDSRVSYYRPLSQILRTTPADFSAVARAVKRQNFVLAGHASIFAQVEDFLAASDAPALVRSLIADGVAPPSIADIDCFVEAAQRVGFTKHDTALLFTSVLLTAAFPEAFVDYRLERWRLFARRFALPVAPAAGHQDNDGAMLVWAGKAGRQFASTPTFRKLIWPAAVERHGDIPVNWIVSGFPFLFRTGSPAHDDLVAVTRKPFRADDNERLAAARKRLAALARKAASR